ncbi:MAG TPA: metallophosphoesterase [Chitinophagaceae bacterium]
MKRCLFILLVTTTAFFKLIAQPVNFTGQELLNRPTNSSVAINVVADQAIDVYFEYGTQSGVYTNQTGTVSFVANDPVKVGMTGLQSNTKYYYRMVYRRTGTTTWVQRPEHFFQTQRSPGSTFKFDISSDSHVNILLGNATTWQRTLTNIDADDPDFLIDCGDTFNMDNITSESGARNSYIFQRSATTFGLVSHSVPVFLAVGNHEQQEAWHLDDNGDPVNSLPVWGTNAQKRYFPNPVPDGFYSGNNQGYYALNGDQLPEDYFAWTWGNALFVVIAPYWHTTEKPFIGNTGGGEPGTSDGDRWHWTLGDAQYNWLKQTLENSTAQYKFLFMHHMTGGTSDYIRGGAYGAPYCEWGGYNEDGTTYAFNTRRPGWSAPIHQVLAANHVSAVFHGHDHQYAYEKLDGVVYQSLPAAGFSGNGFNIYSENDPLTIRALQSGGHLRVTVAPSGTTVDYVSSNTATNGQVMHSYTILPTQNGPLPVQWESFTVQTENNKKVLLNWKTASEFMNKQFIVQRAASTAGNFKSIAAVAATNDPQGASYSFMDEPGLSGTWFYRLIQEDTDGKQLYSETRSIAIKGNKHWQITDNGTSWLVRSNQYISYRLTDISGRLIEKGNFSGTKTIAKPVSGTVYLLTTECNGEITTQKLAR